MKKWEREKKQMILTLLNKKLILKIILNLDGRMYKERTRKTLLRLIYWELKKQADYDFFKQVAGELYDF